MKWQKVDAESQLQYKFIPGHTVVTRNARFIRVVDKACIVQQLLATRFSDDAVTLYVLEYVGEDFVRFVAFKVKTIKEAKEIAVRSEGLAFIKKHDCGFLYVPCRFIKKGRG